MRAVAFTDQQMAVIRACARGVAVGERARFLQALAMLDTTDIERAVEIAAAVAVAQAGPQQRIAGSGR